MLDYNNSRPHPATSSPSPPSTPHEAVEASLSLAQTYIAQGNTTAALQTVFETLRTFCGDTAAQSAAARVESQLLHLHLQPQQPSAQSAISQLADIMNGCRIYNDQPVQPCSSQQIPLEAGMQQLHMQTQPSQYSNSHQPLLTELRGMRLAEPGVTDESSVICCYCGGIVSRSREKVHQQFWCQASRQS